jgi:exonuclease VII large subunit
LDRPARGGGRGGRDTSEADRRKEEADARRLEQDAQRFLAANVPAERYRQQLQEIEDLNQRLIAAGRNPLPEAAVLAAQASALEQYNNAMRNTDEATRRAEQSSKELRQAMESVAREMTRAFEDLVFEGKSFNDVLKDLERSLLRLGNKYLLEPLFQSAMSGLFGGMGGGAGNGTFGAGGYTGKGPFLPSGGGMGGGVAGWIGSAVQLIGSLFHDGGIVGSSRVPTRAVPAAAFYDAPRYHSGGFAGRMPFANDELPAVLKRGELVLTQEQQRAVAGNGRPINQTVIVQTSDPGQFSRTKDQMAREMRRDLARASRSA